MQLHNLAVVIPVKNPPNIEVFIKDNSWLLEPAEVIVVDSGGGEKLEELSKKYIKLEVPFWEARKIGYKNAKKPYILNLDSDVIIPKGYAEEALHLLEDNKSDAVSIFYEEIEHCQGALEFGCSIWKTDVLKKLYDFSMSVVMDGKIVKVGSMAYSTLHHGWCECTYLWRKLKVNGYKLETLPHYRAKHLK